MFLSRSAKLWIGLVDDGKKEEKKRKKEKERKKKNIELEENL